MTPEHQTDNGHKKNVKKQTNEKQSLTGMMTYQTINKTPMTNIPNLEEVKKMGLQKKQGQATVYCYTHTQLENILSDQREAGAREVELTHFVWCPQCGDALEQTGTQNKYNCFGCDTDYQLKTLTPPTK